jgi:hypothetical protein
MTVLDRLYHLEVEFHRHFRSEAINAIEAWSIHTSYALQQGYEPLLKTVGTVDVNALKQARERMIGKSDPRDLQAAFHSLQRLIVVD